MESPETDPPGQEGSYWKRRLLLALGYLVILGLPALLFFLAGVMHPTSESLQLRPFPDATEVAWTAWALANGLPVHMPVGNEWHPSRFHPIHSVLMAGWVRLNGGNWNALFSYSPLAVLLTAFAWLATLRLLGVNLALLLVAGLLLLLSPPVFEVAHLLLQDSTLGLLMALGVLLLVSSFRLPTNDSGLPGWLAVSFGIFSGACWGMAVCARPTLFLLPMAFAVVSVFFLRNRQGVVIAAAVFAGGLLSTVLTLAYGMAILGSPVLNGYGHWTEDHEGITSSAFWSLSNLFASTEESPDYPRWVVALSALIGLRPDFSAAGLLVTLAGWFGAGLYLLRGRANFSETKIQALVALACALAVLLHTLLHGIYQFHLARFYYPMAGAYVAVICLGLQHVGTLSFQRFVKDTRLLSLHLIACIGAGILILLGTFAVFYDQRDELELGGTAQVDVPTDRIPIDFITNYPVFVHGYGSLQARLLFGLEGHPLPVTPLMVPMSVFEDGQVTQFHWLGDLAPPGGTLHTPEAWGTNPLESALLVQHDAIEVRTERLDAILETYGGFQVIARPYSGPVLLHLQTGLSWNELPTQHQEVIHFVVEPAPSDDY